MSSIKHFCTIFPHNIKKKLLDTGDMLKDVVSPSFISSLNGFNNSAKFAEMKADFLEIKKN